MQMNWRVLFMTLVFGLGVASCDDGPTRPSTTPAGPGGGPPPATVARLEIAAPLTIDPGGSAQLTANAIRSDGSVENVTNQAQWTSNNPDVLQFTSSPGFVKATARGEATINARYANQSVNRQVMVLPSGTFLLKGRITESGFPVDGVHVPVDGVNVSVIGGPGDGLTTVTGADGTYALYGVAGRIRLQARKEGFDNSIQEVEVTQHRSLDFEMRFNGDRANFSGTYALAIAAVGCESTLPESARSRSYVANVEQQGARLSVRLSGADFIVFNGRGDHFGGFVAHDGRMTLSIGDFNYYYSPREYDLVERFNANSALVVAGLVSATSTGSGISGTLDGVIALTQGVGGPFTRWSNNCYSSRHGFEMRRQ